MSNKKRPKIVRITLDLVYPDKREKTVCLDPNVTEGIIWSDDTVKILGKYYDTLRKKDKKRMPESLLIKRFGEEVTGELFDMFDPKQEDQKQRAGQFTRKKERAITLSTDVLMHLWNSDYPGNSMRAFMIKIDDCTIW